MWVAFGERVGFADFTEALNVQEKRGLPVLSSISSIYITHSLQGVIGERLKQFSKEAVNCLRSLRRFEIVHAIL